MKKFKIGDKVKVIIDKDALPQGSIHTVTDIYWHWRHEREYVYLNGDNRDSENGWGIHRFELYKEKEQPVKIDMNKKYRRVGTHEPVRVICVDRKVDNDSLPCVGLVLTRPRVEAMVYFDHEGVDQYGQKSIEEVPAVDWSKVDVDTPIIVIDRQGYLRNVHFAGVIDGRICYYPDGRTSHSCGGKIAGGLSVMPHEAKLAKE